MASIGKGARNKGANYERKCAKKIEEKTGIRLERTPLSGGFSKDSSSSALRGDLNTIDPDIKFKLHIECKNQKTWNVKEWWRQTISDCPEEKIPLLIFHENYGDDYVFLFKKDLTNIIKHDNIYVYQRDGKNWRLKQWFEKTIELAHKHIPMLEINKRYIMLTARDFFDIILLEKIVEMK